MASASLFLPGFRNKEKDWDRYTRQEQRGHLTGHQGNGEALKDRIEQDDSRSHDDRWEVLVMFGGINSLGAISASSGLAKWMVNASLAGLENWRAASVIMLIAAFTVVVHLMLPSNPVINGVMIPPIMVLAMSAGKNPALYALPVAFTASCAFLLPLESVPLVTFSKGYYRMFDMFIPGVIISAVWIVVMTAVLLLIGPMVGLF